MRAFIAIELPEQIKDTLGKVQEQLKATGTDVKWVAPENIHLTLKFLGEVDEKKIEKVNAILEDVAKDKNSFSLRLSSLGAFPKMHSPRVIWAGVAEGDKETKEIAKALEEKIAKLGIPKESRPFSSHITLGRTRSNLNRQNLVENLERLAQEFSQDGLEFKATKITLFQSTLTPKGPIYTALKDASLKTT